MGNEERVLKAKERLRTELEAIWLAEPQEIKTIKKDEKIVGPFEQKGSILIYSTRDTGEIAIYLHCLRSMALSQEVDIRSLALVTAKLIETKGDMWRRYYSMEHTYSIMQETAWAMRVVKTKEELADLIQNLSLYLCRFYGWLDETIHWASVSSIIDWELTDK
jgi:hypothetical protein